MSGRTKRENSYEQTFRTPKTYTNKSIKPKNHKIKVRNAPNEPPRLKLGMQLNEMHAKYSLIHDVSRILRQFNKDIPA